MRVKQHVLVDLHVVGRPTLVEHPLKRRVHRRHTLDEAQREGAVLLAQMLEAGAVAAPTLVTKTVTRCERSGPQRRAASQPLMTPRQSSKMKASQSTPPGTMWVRGNRPLPRQHSGSLKIHAS